MMFMKKRSDIKWKWKKRDRNVGGKNSRSIDAAAGYRANRKDSTISPLISNIPKVSFFSFFVLPGVSENGIVLRGVSHACCVAEARAVRQGARARLYIKWCSRFTSQIESRAIGRFSISLNNGLCYTSPTFSRFALSLLLASSPGTLLSPGTFSHFSPGTYPSCFALLRFRFCNLTSLKVFTNKALEVKIFNFRDI